MKKTIYRLSFLLVLCHFALSIHWALAEDRVKPPNWTSDVLSVFFEDARDHLEGSRPAGTDDSQKAKSNLEDSMSLRTGDKNYLWSNLIDSETMVSEIKRLNTSLTKLLSKPANFKGGGNLQCRRDFAVLAALFGRIAEFDEDVRWKSYAPLLQTRFLRTSDLCQEGSDQSFEAAKQMHLDLTDLLRGQFSADEQGLDNNRSSVVELSQLMLRMELALDDTISSAISSKREFRKNQVELAHESQMLAMLAHLMIQPGYEYEDDETFVDYAQRLREEARNLTRSAQQSDYEGARKAVGTMTQSCSECHEGYRG